MKRNKRRSPLTFGDLYEHVTLHVIDKINPDISEILAEALGQLLPEIETKALLLRYTQDGTGSMTFESIGQELGISRERARQTVSKACRRLRTPRRINDFKRLFMTAEELRVETENRQIDRNCYRVMTRIVKRPERIGVKRLCYNFRHHCGIACTGAFWGKPCDDETYEVCDDCVCNHCDDCKCEFSKKKADHARQKREQLK